MAEGHVAALKVLLERGEPFTVNLGTGQGYSVLDVVRAIEQVSGQLVPFQIAHYRPGMSLNAEQILPTRSESPAGVPENLLSICALMHGGGNSIIQTDTLPPEAMKAKLWVRFFPPG